MVEDQGAVSTERPIMDRLFEPLLFTTKQTRDRKRGFGLALVYSISKSTMGQNHRWTAPGGSHISSVLLPLPAVYMPRLTAFL